MLSISVDDDVCCESIEGRQRLWSALAAPLNTGQIEVLNKKSWSAVVSNNSTLKMYFSFANSSFRLCRSPSATLVTSNTFISSYSPALSSDCNFHSAFRFVYFHICRAPKIRANRIHPFLSTDSRACDFSGTLEQRVNYYYRFNRMHHWVSGTQYSLNSLCASNLSPQRSVES